MGRLRALDGLRAIAVVAVLASHTLNHAQGGFLGVDVFFVLSGYLITSLLIREHEETHRIDFAGLYRRRVARLLPAYLLMLVITVPLMAGPVHLVGAWPWPAAVASSAFYLANWAQAGSAENLGPLLHTWSLSVEEQFYTVWPICFLLLTRRARRPARWIAGAVLASVLVRAVGHLVYPGIWPYFATPTHSDGLLVGALVAVLLAWRDRRRSAAARKPSHRADDAPTTGLRIVADDRFAALGAWLSAAVIAGGMAVLTIETPGTYYWGLTLSAAASALIVRHLVVAPHGLMSRLLQLRPLVAVGRVSYGLYLYHMPIFLLVQRRHLGMGPTLVLESAATGAVTVASWYAVEQPVQRWVARRWPRPRRILPGTPVTWRPAPVPTPVPTPVPMSTSLPHGPWSRPPARLPLPTTHPFSGPLPSPYPSAPTATAAYASQPEYQPQYHPEYRPTTAPAQA